VDVKDILNGLHALEREVSALKKENTELKARLSKFENLKWFLVL